MFDDYSFKEEVFKKLGGFNDTIGVISPEYNIAPTLSIAIYTNRHLYTYANFGLIPSWADSRSKMQINARSESVYEKSSFKEAYKSRRCIIPLNGYFEWKKDSDTKKSQAYFVVSSSADYFTFAGIYESWYDNKLKKTILTCALLTTQPNETIELLHDRMPVILESYQWDIWLNDSSSLRELNKLFIPIKSEKVRYFPVGELVNSVKNNTAECIKEVAEISVPRQGTLF